MIPQWLIKKMLEDFVRDNPEYIGEILLKIAEDRPRMMAKVFFTVLNELDEKELAEYRPGLQKIVRVAMGKRIWNDTMNKGEGVKDG